MLVALLILLTIVFSNCSFAKENEFYNDYLGQEETRTINGIFVSLILFSHYAQYAPMTGGLDVAYLSFRAHFGQLVVVPILFYSGYGTMESIKRKGMDYVNRFPGKFLKLLFRFEFAVCCFLALDLCLRIPLTKKQILLSFALWDSIGNSNWYIFDILLMYIISAVSFKIAGLLDKQRSNYYGTLLVFVLTLTMIYILIKTGRDAQWYNTIIFFPIGLAYSLFQKKIDSHLWKNDYRWLGSISLLLLGYGFMTLYKAKWGLLSYTVWALCFILILLLLTMKIRINNAFLKWLGIHVFSIYILQRLPMITLYKIGWIQSNQYISLVSVIAATFVLVVLFEIITEKIINAVYINASMP